MKLAVMVSTKAKTSPTRRGHYATGSPAVPVWAIPVRDGEPHRWHDGAIGVGKVSAEMAGFVQGRAGHGQATLDMAGEFEVETGQEWAEAARFALINLAGRVVFHARKPLTRLARGHPSFPLLVGARRRVATLAHGPPCS